MKRMKLIIPALLVAALAGGCVVRAHTGVRAHYSQPSMVLVHDDVYVIEDYDEPVFYSENAYWRYHGGVWYSSSYHTGGWVQVRTVPRHVGRIDRPDTYVRYRGKVKDHRREVRQDRRDDRREHRQDVRDDRREHRQDARDDRREHRQEDKVDRRDHRQETRGNKDHAKVKDRNPAGKVKARDQRSGDGNKGGKVNKRDHRK